MGLYHSPTGVAADSQDWDVALPWGMTPTQGHPGNRPAFLWLILPWCYLWEPSGSAFLSCGDKWVGVTPSLRSQAVSIHDTYFLFCHSFAYAKRPREVVMMMMKNYYCVCAHAMVGM